VKIVGPGPKVGVPLFVDFAEKMQKMDRKEKNFSVRGSGPTIFKIMGRGSALKSANPTLKRVILYITIYYISRVCARKGC
jgi:hypothetical protein